MFSRQVIGSVLVLGCCGAWADAETSIDIRARAGEEQVTQDTGPVQNSLTYSYGGGTGTAFANLQTGILRDYAVAPPYPGGSDFSYSVVQSRIAEVITFSPTASGTAYLYWSVDGTLPAFDGHLDSTALMALFVSGGTNAISEDHAFDNNSCAPYSVTTCESGTRWSQSGVVAFQIDGNDPISIQVLLASYPSDGGVGDFSNTGRLYLEVPAGETFNSNSGVFLNEATPLAAVPEPVPGVLLMGGLGLLVARYMRRSGRGPFGWATPRHRMEPGLDARMLRRSWRRNVGNVGGVVKDDVMRITFRLRSATPALLAVFALSSMAFAEGLVANGEWSVSFNDVQGRARQARLNIEGTSGTWQLFSFAGRGAAKSNPCMASGLPATVQIGSADDMIVDVKSDSHVVGCEGFTLTLKRVDANTFDGTFSDTRTVHLVRN